MTDQERDALLLELRDAVRRIETDHGARLERLETGLSEIRQDVTRLQGTVDTVSNGLQDLRRDLEEHYGLPPQDQAI